MDVINHTYVVLAFGESQFLEECINSVLNQKFNSQVVIATSTPNRFISDMATKYNLNIILNKDYGKGIGNDFNFAVNCVNADIITIAHQDDIYDYEYSYEIVNHYTKYKDSLIIFTDYYEIRDGKKVAFNLNLTIKRVLLFFLKFQSIANLKIIKRSAICFGNAISCPAVSFVKDNIKYKEIFGTKYKCNVDWAAWQKLYQEEGRFIFVKKKLMGHRVHQSSTTTQIIKENNRTKEDYTIFCKFWPKWFANLLCKVYRNSEKSNFLNEK